MTVNTETNVVVYQGNGSATEFDFPFKVPEAEYLLVTRRESATGAVEYVYLASDYVVTGLGDEAGGSITFNTAPLAGSDIVIKRIVPYTQELDIVNQGGFYPDTVEQQLDLGVMQTQQIASEVGRSLRVLEGDSLDPLPLSRAGMFLGFDALGNPVALSGTGSDSALRTDLASSGGAALIGVGGGQTLDDVVDLAQAIRMTDAISGNFIMGSSDSGADLTNNPSGAHDGDSNTGYGYNVFAQATTAYASCAFGYGALANVTTGSSNTAFGYQAGVSLITGEQNTLLGLDAGLLMVAGNRNVVVGHHCLNGGNFAGEGAVIIGQQTARNLTSGNYITAIGRNVFANTGASGTQFCEVIGGGACIGAKADKSTVIGTEAISIATGTISESIVMGYRAAYGAASLSQSILIGAFSMFRGSGGAGNQNIAVGYEAGNSVAGEGNTFLGHRAGYRGANTDVNGAICIGRGAGLNTVTTGMFVVQVDGNVLMTGDIPNGNLAIDNNLQVGGDRVRITTSNGPSSNGPGQAGDICWDSGYVYVCVATNTWKRAALSSY